MLYTPLLPEAASGTLEPRHCVVPLRVDVPAAPSSLLGGATALDLDARTAEIETDDGARRSRGDELVTRARRGAAELPVPGLAEHGLPFKTLADAIHLRNHVLRQLEAADAALDDEERRRRLTFVFVGAGYAGVEALAELSDLVEDALRFYPRPARRAPALGARRRGAADPPGDPVTGSVSMPRRSWRRGASRSTSARPSSRSTDDEVVLGDGTRIADATRSSGPQASRPTRCCGELGPAARRPRPRRGRRVAAGTRPGARLVARRLRPRPEHAQPTRPDPPTCQHALRQARRLARTSQGDARRRTATGCSARLRRSAATRESRTCSACGCAASRAGG